MKNVDEVLAKKEKEMARVAREMDALAITARLCLDDDVQTEELPPSPSAEPPISRNVAMVLPPPVAALPPSSPMVNRHWPIKMEEVVLPIRKKSRFANVTATIGRLFRGEE